MVLVMVPGKGKETDGRDMCIYLDAALRAFGADTTFYSCVLTVGVYWKGGKRRRKNGVREIQKHLLILISMNHIFPSNLATHVRTDYQERGIKCIVIHIVSFHWKVLKLAAAKTVNN